MDDRKKSANEALRAAYGGRVVVDVDRDSMASRVRREKEKAIAKYGELGQLPGGDPNRDILDYTINEVVGLLRYSDMLHSRFGRDPHVLELCGRIELFSRIVGEKLIDYRNDLIQKGVHLGEPEQQR